MAPTPVKEIEQQEPAAAQQEPEPMREDQQQNQDGQIHDDSDEEYHDSSAEHQPIDPAKHPITPAINKRRQATKLHMVQSPTDNIFSPISKKLLGRKRTDIVKELPEF